MPRLIVIAAGFWIVSLFCDLLYLGGAEAGLWVPLAFYAMVGGFAAALAAVAPAVVRSGLAHLPVYLVVATLYALNIWLRMGDAAPLRFAIWLSVVGVGALAISTWLGGTKAQPAL